jgi:hypothetical protein
MVMVVLGMVSGFAKAMSPVTLPLRHSPPTHCRLFSQDLGQTELKNPCLNTPKPQIPEVALCSAAGQNDPSFIFDASWAFWWSGHF